MKKSKKRIRKIIFYLSVAIILFYFVVLFLQQKLEFSNCQITNYDDSITVQAMAIRDEYVIKLDNIFEKNNVMMNCKNADKVAKDFVIARIYRSPKEKENACISYAIDEKINSLETKPKSYMTESIKHINQKINNSIEKLKLINSISQKEKIKQELWDLLNKKAISIGKNDSFESKILNLKNQKDSIYFSDSINIVKSPYCGIFLNSIDGFENAFEYESKGKYESININEISQGTEDKSVFGKIIKNDTWYIVFEVYEDNIDKIKKSNTISFSVCEKDFAQNIPCTLNNIYFDSKNGKYIVTLSCGYLNENLSYLRKENFKITLGNYQGIKIPKSAIYKEGDFFGIYVNHGGYLEFKKINIIFSDTDFVISDVQNSQDEGYVKQGDKMVIFGNNLYSGKKV